jgi:hypothetical protein
MIPASVAEDHQADEPILVQHVTIHREESETHAIRVDEVRSFAVAKPLLGLGLPHDPR